MYNIGGAKSSHSVAWCRLSSNYPVKWKFIHFSNFNFKRYYDREALVVENKIVYFGVNNKNATFLLEQEESEQLKVVR